MRKDIRKYGTRNVTLLAMAPTGTISLIPETTSGIEPLFAQAYKRTDRISDRIYIHQKYKEVLESGGETPDWLVDTRDLQPEDHINTQVAIQRFVDGAVSKTLNVPEDFSSDELSELLLESILDIKGMTLYKEGSRKEQILTPLSEEEAKAHINDATSEQDDTAVDCDGGSCGI
jgi:ribonucleoside-diphosphate reductase alpha chain